MYKSDKNIEEKKEKLKSFIKDKSFISLAILLIISFILRVYYLFEAGNQPMWWDEAEYMSTAKYWGLGVPYDINPQRPPLFQLLAAFLIKIGFTEIWLKFVLVVLPSVLIVFLVYLLGKEMFNKRIALFSAIGTAFIWSLIFWSIRFQPDFFSLSFQLLSILFFWKLFKKDKKSHAIFAGSFAALAFYFKISALLVPLSIFLFILYKDGLKFLRIKNYWICLLSFLITMLPFAIWQYILFGNPTAFAPSYIGGAGIGQGWDFGWMTLNYFYYFPKFIFFIMFIIGISYVSFNILMSFDLMIKDKKYRLDPWVLSLIFLIVIALFYIFYIRGIFIEDRWVFLFIPFIMFFSSKGLDLIYNSATKYGKQVSIILIIVIFGIFIYAQINHTDDLINAKKDSYLPVKEASLLIKEISEPDESILSVSYTQTTAYSEREVHTYSGLSYENFTKILSEEKPSYLIVSILEPHHPPWIIQQGNTQDGNYAVIMPYFNSTIIISQQNQLLLYDVKREILIDNEYAFELIYPTNGFNGLFAYKINYISESL